MVNGTRVLVIRLNSCFASSVFVHNLNGAGNDVVDLIQTRAEKLNMIAGYLAILKLTPLFESCHYYFL